MRLIPVFQPVVSMRNRPGRRCRGAGPLAPTRYQRLCPAEFVQLAGRRVRSPAGSADRRARCRTLRRLLRDRTREFHLAINVSAKTVDAKYIGYLAELIRALRNPPERLTIELTGVGRGRESGRIGIVDRASIARGDGGHRRLWDRLLLAGLPAEPAGRRCQVGSHFVDRLHSDPARSWPLGDPVGVGPRMRIIAEGVETAEQEALRRLGYDWVQGYRYETDTRTATARRLQGLGQRTAGVNKVPNYSVGQPQQCCVRQRRCWASSLTAWLKTLGKWLQPARS